MLICCGRPSSSTVKSSLLRFGTDAPFPSLATTSTTTNRVLVFNTVLSWPSPVPAWLVCEGAQIGNNKRRRGAASRTSGLICRHSSDSESHGDIVSHHSQCLEKLAAAAAEPRPAAVLSSIFFASQK